MHTTTHNKAMLEYDDLHDVDESDGDLINDGVDEDESPNGCRNLLISLIIIAAIIIGLMELLSEP